MIAYKEDECGGKKMSSKIIHSERMLRCQDVAWISGCVRVECKCEYVCECVCV